MQIFTEVFIFVVIVLIGYLNNSIYNVVRLFKKISIYKLSLTGCNFSENNIGVEKFSLEVT